LTHPKAGGQTIDVSVLVQWLCDLWSARTISGLTLSGGEPLEQPAGVAYFLERLREKIPTLSIGLFSGYGRTELDRGRYNAQSNLSGEPLEILWTRIRECLDFAVLGRYNHLQPAAEPLVTSRNQSIELYSTLYSPDDFSDQTVEVTIDAQGLTQITGFPVLG